MFDLVVLLIIIFFFLAGWRRGFCLYSLEVLTTVISLGAAWFYYQQTREIVKSSLVLILVFLGLTLLKWLLLKVWRKKAQDRPKSSLANKSCGGVLGLIWGTLMASLLILAVEFLPSEVIFHYNIKEKAQQAVSAQIVHRLIPTKQAAVVDNMRYISKIGLDQQAQLRLIKQPKFQELLEHESLKQILDDPELVALLKKKDLSLLLTHPKILELLNDGEFAEKLMQLDFQQALEEVDKK